MSNSKSTDHWNVLARLLGTAPPEAEVLPEAETPAEAVSPTEALVETPAAKAEMPETSPTADRFTDLFEEPPSAQRDSQPEPTPEITAGVEPARVEVHVPARPAPKAAPPSKPSKPKVNHWHELAGSLGIEVTEPEPEPEAVPVVAEIDVQITRPAPSISTQAREFEDREAHGRWTKTTDQEPRRIPSAERGVDAGTRTRSEPRQGSRRASLFEDPDLSLDTPGVLDSIFDEVDLEPAADSPSAVDQHPEKVRGDRRERAEKFVPKERERDLLFSDEPADEEVEEVVAERGESEVLRDADEEDRPGRRRKRRRRRGGRRDQKPTAEETQGEAADETQGEAAEEGFEEDEELMDRRRHVTDIRERRPAVRSEEPEGIEDEADDHLEDDEDDDDEAGGERLRLKHKKIPTWEQAIDAIVAVNMESRAKNPGGGGAGRGRGRRWRR